MIKSNIGKTIKHYRKLAGFSQDEVAEKMGIKRQTISSWETNRTEPCIQDVQRMAEIFGCETDDILSGYRETMQSARQDAAHWKKYSELPQTQKDIVNNLIDQLHALL